MAVDPNTGQSVIGFDQKYAQFVDPATMGQLTAQQGKLGQQSGLAHAMLQAGYVPNSGFAGALSQGLQAFLGMKMLNDSRDKMASVNQQILEATQKAATAAHTQAQQDKTFDTNEAVRQATQIHSGEAATDVANRALTDPLDVAKAGATAGAQSNAEQANKIQLANVDNAGKIAAAVAAARENNRGMKIEKNTDGSYTAFLPHTDAQGNIQVSTSNVGVPGGAQPSPAQQKILQAAQDTLTQFNQKKLAADEARGHIVNYVSQMTGQDPAKVGAMSNDDMSNSLRNVNPISATVSMIPGVSGGPIASSRSAALSYAGTIRATPTDTDVRSAKDLTPSPYDSRETQANKVRGMLSALDQVDKARQDTINTIAKLQPTGAASQLGGIPGSTLGQPGPQAPQQASPQGALAPNGGMPSTQDIMAELARRHVAGQVPQDMAPTQ